MKKQPNNKLKKIEIVVATKCGLCHETNGEHLLSCPTRWYK